MTIIPDTNLSNMTQRFPNEIISIIAKACVSPYSLAFTSRRGLDDGKLIGFPNVINVILVNRFFFHEVVKECIGNFNGRLFVSVSSRYDIETFIRANRPRIQWLLDLVTEVSLRTWNMIEEPNINFSSFPNLKHVSVNFTFHFEVDNGDTITSLEAGKNDTYVLFHALRYRERISDVVEALATEGKKVTVWIGVIASDGQMHFEVDIATVHGSKILSRSKRGLHG